LPLTLWGFSEELLRLKPAQALSHQSSLGFIPARHWLLWFVGSCGVDALSSFTYS